VDHEEHQSHRPGPMESTRRQLLLCAAERQCSLSPRSRYCGIQKKLSFTACQSRPQAWFHVGRGSCGHSGYILKSGFASIHRLHGIISVYLAGITHQPVHVKAPKSEPKTSSKTARNVQEYTSSELAGCLYEQVSDFL
jgi:hypothetical protein